MDSIGIQRKLKAIFSADVKGYSKLMGADDEATVNTITAYREIITESIQNHQGRVVDSTGDNILAEFSSALNAVKSAIDIQGILEIKNTELPDDRRMYFRIGINLGDILHKDNRIYGDGVNVAARIESLADAGGICISRGVYDQVKKNVSQEFEYMGEHSVKNISEPVRIYRIFLSPGSEKKPKREPVIKSNRIPYALIIAVLVVVCAGVIYKFYPRPPTTESTLEGVKALTLPDKPTIAVLPFVNMSNDPEGTFYGGGVPDKDEGSAGGLPEGWALINDTKCARICSSKQA